MTITLYLPLSATVKQLRVEIEKEWGKPMQGVQLVYDRQLMHDQFRLFSYGINEEDTVRVMRPHRIPTGLGLPALGSK